MQQNVNTNYRSRLTFERKISISENQATLNTQSPTILQRIAKSEKAAVEDCINAYGNLIWVLAKKYTNSAEAAEVAVINIFNEIWQTAVQYDSTYCSEEKYVLRIAFRQLLEQSIFKH